MMHQPPSFFIKKCQKQQGFSLIELAVIIVIIGLITGGIVTSQHLIRAAELRNITAKLDLYNRALTSFRSKYLALPGDMAKATNLWGAEPGANCPGNAGTPSTGLATCNGNDNGRITTNPGAGLGNEVFRAWQHLANADMVDGSFSGVAGALSANHAIGNENAPTTKIADAVLIFQYLGDSSADEFAGNYGNSLIVGIPNAVNGAVDMPFLRPEEALNIDEKQDDGFPGIGRIRSRNASKHPNCATSDDANSAVYDLSNNNIACQLVYVTGY